MKSALEQCRDALSSAILWMDTNYESSELAHQKARAAISAADAALAASSALCMCKDRPAQECPGQWEPGCDLGANVAHVRVALPAAQPVRQYRTKYCADWYDGIPAHEEGRGPYEVRTLYAAPALSAAPHLLTDDRIYDLVRRITGDTKGALFQEQIIQFTRAIERAHGITKEGA